MKESANARPILDRSLFPLLGAVHAVGCLHYFPLWEIFSGKPLLTSDYVQRYFEAVRVARYLRGGTFLGYCTTWSAGFVDGFGGLINNKPLSLLLFLAPPSLHPLAFNLGVLLALWLFPPLVYAAARRFGHRRSQATLAMALAMTFWYGSMLCRLFWRGGSVLFFVASGVALWAAGCLFARWTDDGERPGLPLVVFAVTLVPWIHAGAAPIVAVMGMLAYLLTIRSRGLRAGEAALVAVVVPLANLPWLWPFLEHRHLYRSWSAYPIYPGGLRNLLFDFVRGPLHMGGGPREETVILAPLVVLAALGMAKLRRPRLLPLLVASAAVFFLVAYAGSALGAGATQPYRFVIPLGGVLSITAAGGLDWLRDERPARRRAAIFLASLALLVGADRIRIARYAGDHLGAGLGETETWALGELRAAAAPRGGRIAGRVLLEGDWMTDSVPRRPRARRVSYSFAGFEGALEGEFIGAPIMSLFAQQELASFWRGYLFGRELASYDRDSFLDVCRAYDIRWAVTLHDSSKLKLESFGADVERLAQRGGVAIFRIHAPRSGRTVAAGSDGRTIEVATDSSDPIVLPYHWNPLLSVKPAAELRPTPTTVDPRLQFIEMIPPSRGVYRIGIEP